MASRRDAVKIARRFNAGWAVVAAKSRRDDRKFQPSLRDSVSILANPALKRRAIFSRRSAAGDCKPVLETWSQKICDSIKKQIGA